MRYRTTAAPTVEPVTLEEAMLHLRIDGYGESPAHPDEPLIESLITAAREWAEDYTGRILAPREVEIAVPALPASYHIPVAPVRSIEGVTYVDTDGVTQTLDPALYGVYLDPDDTILAAAYGETYPDYRPGPEAFKITVGAGYEDDSPSTVPLPNRVRVAILLMVGHLYENREDSTPGSIPVSRIPQGAEYLLHSLRRAIL